MNYITNITHSDDGFHCHCFISLTPEIVKVILERMNLARELKQQDPSLYALEFWDATAIPLDSTIEDFLELPSVAIHPLTELEAQQIRQYLLGYDRITWDCMTMVIDGNEVVWQWYENDAQQESMPLNRRELELYYGKSCEVC